MAAEDQKAALLEELTDVVQKVMSDHVHNRTFIKIFNHSFWIHIYISLTFFAAHSKVPCDENCCKVRYPLDLAQ